MAVKYDSRWDIVYGREESINSYFWDDYETRLSFQTAGTSCVLPVLPEELSITQGSSHVRHKIINGYEVTQLGTRTPREFTIKSFFPHDRHPYLFTQPWENTQKGVTRTSTLGNLNQREVYLDQKSYIDFFSSAMERAIPIRVVFRGLEFIDREANIFTVESFTWGYRYGTKDVDFTLSFKEYMEASVQSYTAAKVDEKTGAITLPPVSNPTTSPKTGKFAVGDKVTATGRWTGSSDGTGGSGAISSGTVYEVTRIMDASISWVKNPYRLSLRGVHQGWVAANQMKHA